MRKGDTGFRLCVSCRTFKRQEELLRVTKTDAGYIWQPEPTVHGRSAYVCRKACCIERMRSRRLLNRSFKASVPDEVYEAVPVEENHE